MTCREKLKLEHPDCVGDEYGYGVKGCPSDYGYLPDPRCATTPCGSVCWEREIPEEKEEPHIKDSGDRTEFATGAVRDMREGKGRCDLMPLMEVGHILNNVTLTYIAKFQEMDDVCYLRQALTSSGVFHDAYTMFLEVAKHFEEGAKKYGEHNWQKGIPTHCYIDSAVRHYLKWLRGDNDEPHDRAFCWNILCCIWTCVHKPELNNYE